MDDIEISRLKIPVHPVRITIDGIEELANSINQNGLIQSIVVRSLDAKNYEIIAGTRRFHACKKLGWRKIPCHVIEIGDQEAFEIALIENVQRNSLSILDEGRAFKRYVSDFGWGGITNLAEKIGKSVSYVTKKIKLLELPTPILEFLENSDMTVSMAEELSSVGNKQTQIEAAELIIKNQLTLRNARDMLKDKKESSLHEIGFHNQHSLNEIMEAKRRRSLDKAIVTLRIAMNRIGNIIENSEDEFLFKILMDHKTMLHEQISVLMKEKKKIP